MQQVPPAALIDVLIFAEDPGAANFLAPIPAALAATGLNCKFLAAGLARGFLQAAGVACTEAAEDAQALQLFAETRPRLLLVGTAENLDSLGLKLIEAAKQLGLPSIAVIDAAMNAARRFCGHGKDPRAYAPDWLIVADDWTKSAFLKLGFQAAQLVVCGNPHHDTVLEEGARLTAEGTMEVRRRVLPEVVGDRRVLVFVDEGSARLSTDASDYVAAASLRGRGAAAGRTELVMEELLLAVQGLTPRPWLVLRLHPKDRADDYAAYLGEFDQVSSGGSALDFTYAADLVVGMSSMLLFEAVLLGRPTLSILPYEAESDWLPSVRAGITPSVSTRTELRRVLGAWSQGRGLPPALAALASKGGNTARIASFIEGLLCPARIAQPIQRGT